MPDNALSLEAAEQVIAAHREVERAAKIEEKRQFIGRYFKYRNRYGGDEAWWLYGAVTGVGEWGHLEGWCFQHTTMDSIEVELKRHIDTIVGANIEITADEFWTAAARLHDEVRARLCGREQP